MTNARPIPSYFSTIQAAKATLRRRDTGPGDKSAARAYLSAEGWSTKRLIEYESLPYMIQYNVTIKLHHTRTISVPALSTSDAHIATTKMFPDWRILTIIPTSHDTKGQED